MRGMIKVDLCGATWTPIRARDLAVRDIQTRTSELTEMIVRTIWNFSRGVVMLSIYVRVFRFVGQVRRSDRTGQLGHNAAHVSRVSHYCNVCLASVPFLVIGFHDRVGDGIFTPRRSMHN